MGIRGWPLRLWPALLVCGAAQALTADPSNTAALKKLSLEDLLAVEVTSVSRTAEPLGGAAAAVAVVSNEDIRRSGALSVPEALRLIPGLNVAQQSANGWAVSARGFTSANSEKLLVLSDTRSIYTPLFSGVFWDVQDYVLNDIDRIEVIRGPGASLWGSNAVNGVINITTKNAADTQGGYAEAIAGTTERAIVTARYGGETDSGVYYRVFGKYSDHDSSVERTTDNRDDWQLGHLGFRTDWRATQHDAFTLQGDWYDGDIGQVSPSVQVIGRPGPTGRLRVDVSGGNVLGRWQHSVNEDSDLQLRVYYDHTHRDDPSYRDDLDTADVDFQHHFRLGTRQEVVWGLNYRYTHDRNEGKVIFAVNPPSSTDTLVSGFVQDQIALLQSLRLTVGTKLEHNDFSGFETQPSIRLAWDITSAQTLWSAVSRAVRVPTRLERDIAIDASNPNGNPVIRLLGNRNFDSEKLTAYELGYRWQIRPTLSADLATFYNRYKDLASLELGTPFIDPTGRTIIPVVNENRTDGNTQGFEALINYEPLRNWHLSASYSYLNMRLDAHGLDLNRGRFIADATPRNQFGLRSLLDVTKRLQVDGQFRYMSAIRNNPLSPTPSGVPGYSELDLRVAYQLWQNVQIAVVGQNLLHAHHPEFGLENQRGEMERSVYGKVSCHF